MNKKNIKRIGIALIVIIIVLNIIWHTHVADYMSLTFIKNQRDYLFSLVKNHYLWSSCFYILIYTSAVFLGLFIIILLSILGGYLFGFATGTFFSLISALIGSSAYFLIIQRTMSTKRAHAYSKQLAHFQRSMQTYGASYLLFLHFINIVPYIVINTLAALSHISLSTFAWTTVVAALPSLLIYSFAGTQLTSITSVYDIIKPPFFLLFLALALLSLIPIVISKWRSKQKPI